MSINVHFETQSASSDSDVAIGKHNHALDLQRHSLLVDDSAFDARQRIPIVVNFAVVLHQNQCHVAVALVLRHSRFQGAFYLADERVNLVVILLLSQSVSIGKYGLKDGLETTGQDYFVDHYFVRLRLHL